MSEKKQLNLEDLEEVSGGYTYHADYNMTWQYHIGDKVNVYYFLFFHDEGTIRHRGILTIAGKGNRPGYYVDGGSEGWYEEDEFDTGHRFTDRDVVAWLD